VTKGTVSNRAVFLRCIYTTRVRLISTRDRQWCRQRLSRHVRYLPSQPVVVDKAQTACTLRKQLCHRNNHAINTTAIINRAALHVGADTERDDWVQSLSQPIMKSGRKNYTLTTTETSIPWDVWFRWLENDYSCTLFSAGDFDP